MENSNTEVEVKNIRAYNKEVSGCVRHNKDIMIAFDSTDKSYDIKDLFLDKEQAKSLVDSLTKALKENE